MNVLNKLVTEIDIEMSGDTKHYAVTAKQGDKATRNIVARLLNKGEEYTIPATGVKALVNIRKPDGKSIYNACTYSGSSVTIELTNQALAVAGTAYCDIEIRTEDDGEVISSASFTIEIERSMRNEAAIKSSNEFTDLEKWTKEAKEAETIRQQQEADRQRQEEARQKQESEREKQETIRQQQEADRQRNTTAAINSAEKVASAAAKATEKCINATERAEVALENQDQLNETLNDAKQIQKNVVQIRAEVIQNAQQVEADKAEIKETIEDSLIGASQEILESVKNYLARAEALYSSMYLDCDGETPHLRTVTPIVIEGGTPKMRSVDAGVDFDGGTPLSRTLVA